MSGPQPLTTEQFLDEALASGAGSQAIMRLKLMRESGMEYSCAIRAVQEYCDRKAPNLPLEGTLNGDNGLIHASGRDDVIACLVVPAIFAVLGGLIWLVYRTLTTPPKPNGSSTAFPANPATVGFSLLIVGSLVWSLVRGKARRYWWVYRRITLRIVAETIVAGAATIATAVVLVTLFPFLNRSWLYLLPGSNGHAINVNLMPVEIRYLAPVFLLAFALCIPWLAHGEEEQYRRGTKDWKHATRRSLRFGLAHCVWAGVLLHIGLALSVAGFWFTRQYFLGGVERSTVYHATYNLLIVGVLALALIFGGF